MKFALALLFTSLAACYGQEPTVVAFLSARCPISNAYNLRMASLFRDYSAKGVRFRFVNANSNETDAEVAAHARQVGYPFTVERDTDDLAGLFDAEMTPTVLVIDKAGMVRYRGMLDDAQNEARIKHRYVREALDAVLAGKPVPVAETKTFGCTIKRAARLAPIDDAGYTRLLQSHKGEVLLVDFWATWCEPCREELPRLASLAKTLKFTLATISTDEPEQQAAASALLDREHVPGPRYRKFWANDQALIESVDRNWSGALPALFLYDRSGTRAGTFTGNFAMDDLVSALRSLQK